MYWKYNVACTIFYYITIKAILISLNFNELPLKYRYTYMKLFMYFNRVTMKKLWFGYYGNVLIFMQHKHF